MNNPLLTVLMPVYNAEKFLKEAIDSILNQTFSTFEFLIIDDGSTDSGVEIIESYIDPRIRLIKNEKNLGISATLNKGIEMARTELIARMDADDISYPTRLQKQFDFFKHHPDCALLSTWAREVTENLNPVSTEEFKSSYYYYSLNFECWIYHPTVMYKRSAVIDVGKYSVPYCEDFDLWWKLSRKYKIDNIEEVLLDYRTNDESISRKVFKKEYDEGHRQQLVRNIHFYAGNNFGLNENEIEFLRSNFEPVTKDNDVKAIVRCFQKLEYITDCILAKDNVNHNEPAIQKAAQAKRDWSLYSIGTLLPLNKKLLLYMQIDKKRQFKKSISALRIT